MSGATVRWRRPQRVLPLLALGMLLPALVVFVATVKAPDASAHGSAVDPPARAYSCWKRWGDQWQSPAMATEDPMCDQAWKADPNAMWNWNGLYRDGVKGDHQAAVPDGQLCSGGHTAGGRYNALDKPGPWHAVPLANSFSVRVHDQATHGADYYRVYVTKQGFDALTQPLGWGDLDLVAETGKIAPGAGSPGGDPALSGGVSVAVDARAPGRTGRHIVYTVWQASHSDQSYYFCSDVIFGGAGAEPGPSTPPPPATAPAPPITKPPTPATTVAPGPAPVPAPAVGGGPAGGGGCTASYRMLNQWPGGFQGEVTVAATGGPLKGWTVRGTFPDGQTVRQAWNSTMTGGGSSMVAANAAWNGTVPAGGTTTFGFLGDWIGANRAPALACEAA
jgi:predicted carbohydrate-binding protein with CBM5 and CBM33 domain